MPRNGFRYRAGVLTIVEVGAVVAAWRLVPLLFDVGDRARLVRRVDELADLGVVAEVRLHVRVYHRTGHIADWLASFAHAVTNTSPSLTSTRYVRILRRGSASVRPFVRSNSH